MKFFCHDRYFDKARLSTNDNLVVFKVLKLMGNRDSSGIIRGKEDLHV